MNLALVSLCQRCGSLMHSNAQLEAASNNRRTVFCGSCIRKYYDKLGRPNMFQWGIAVGVIMTLVGLMVLGAIGVWLTAG